MPVAVAEPDFVFDLPLPGFEGLARPATATQQPAYTSPGLLAEATASPDTLFRVIVQGEKGTATAEPAVYSPTRWPARCSGRIATCRKATAPGKSNA